MPSNDDADAQNLMSAVLTPDWKTVCSQFEIVSDSSIIAALGLMRASVMATTASFRGEDDMMRS